MNTIRRLADVERELIVEAVSRFGAHRAAVMLGIGKTTLYRKLRSYKLDPKKLYEEAHMARLDAA